MKLGGKGAPASAPPGRAPPRPVEELPGEDGHGENVPTTKGTTTRRFPEFGKERTDIQWGSYRFCEPGEGDVRIYLLNNIIMYIRVDD